MATRNDNARHLAQLAAETPAAWTARIILWCRHADTRHAIGVDAARLLGGRPVVAELANPSPLDWPIVSGRIGGLS